MIDYGILMTEQCIDEISTGAAAGIGAGVGAAGSVGAWAVRRIALKNKMKDCKELPHGEIGPCEDKIKKEIKKLRSRALKYGALSTVGGAGLGVAAKGATELIKPGKELYNTGKNAYNVSKGITDVGGHNFITKAATDEVGKRALSTTSNIIKRPETLKGLAKLGGGAAIFTAGGLAKDTMKAIHKRTDKKD